MPVCIHTYTLLQTILNRSAHVPKQHGAIQLQSKTRVATLDVSVIEIISPVSRVYHYAGSIGGFESKLCHVEPVWTGRTHLSLFPWDITDIFPGELEVKDSKYTANEVWVVWKKPESKENNLVFQNSFIGWRKAKSVGQNVIF